MSDRLIRNTVLGDWSRARVAHSVFPVCAIPERSCFFSRVSACVFALLRVCGCVCVHQRFRTQQRGRNEIVHWIRALLNPLWRPITLRTYLLCSPMK